MRPSEELSPFEESPPFDSDDINNAVYKYKIKKDLEDLSIGTYLIQCYLKGKDRDKDADYSILLDQALSLAFGVCLQRYLALPKNKQRILEEMEYIKVGGVTRNLNDIILMLLDEAKTQLKNYFSPDTRREILQQQHTAIEVSADIFLGMAGEAEAKAFDKPTLKILYRAFKQRQR
jgi:hypothetical protein